MRIFNTYGPRMHKNDGRVVSNFVVQALMNKKITIYGDGQQTRSFCYVHDLVRGMILLMNSNKKILGPINFGNPNEITILELAKIIVRLSKSKSKIENKDLPIDDPKKRKPDISCAIEKINWNPNINLEDGLIKTIKYFRKTLKNE